MAFVQAIAHAYAARGLCPNAAMAQAQIAPSQWRDAAARITARQMEALSSAAMQALDDEALGWFSRRLPWGSYGMLLRASLSAPQLGVALQRWCRHHRLLTDDVTLSLRVEGEVATLRIAEHRTLGEGGALREFALVSLLRNALGVACWLIDSRIPLHGAQFPFAAPAHHSAYAVLFSGPTRFDADCAALRFDARYLSLPLRRDEAALRHMLQRPLPLMVHWYRRDRLLGQRVRQAFSAQPAQLPNAAALAALLHVSPRTLHRQLKEEGASLQSLRDEVRREQTTELLLRTPRPLKQIAQAVGFHNEKSLIRAFKGWTGHTPAEFRANAQNLPS